MIRRKLVSGFLYLIAILGCFPIYFLVISSFRGGGELRRVLLPMFSVISDTYMRFSLLPSHPTLRYYIHVLLDSPEFFTTLWNTTYMTTVILLLQLIVGVPAAWAFAKFEFPFRKTLFTVYIILMMMPFQVTMLSNFIVLDHMHLLDTYWAVTLPVGFSTFPIIIMYRFFRGIPAEILEAAKIDGAGEWKVFRYITLPIGSSGIISAMVLGFIESWSLIEQPITFLRNPALWPLSMYLPNITLDNAGHILAASVIGMVPAILVFLAGQDYLEKGIMAVAIKE